MKVEDTEFLEYLHDALMESIHFEEHKGTKRLIMKATFDEDCGNTDWDGKAAIITFSDVIVATAIFLGHVTGQDMVQSFRQGISVVTHQRLATLIAAGVPAPEKRLTIALQSGSEIEVACAEINVAAT